MGSKKKSEKLRVYEASLRKKLSSILSDPPTDLINAPPNKLLPVNNKQNSKQNKKEGGQDKQGSEQDKSRNKKEKEQKKRPSHPLSPTFIVIASFLAAVLLFLLSFSSLVAYRVYYIHKVTTDAPLTEDEGANLTSYLQTTYKEEYKTLKPLPYNKLILPFTLDLNAKSAILVNAHNGNILYEKDAEAPIPPASITKLFVMYIAFEELEKGRISLEDVVPLPPSVWASNMMPHSSLMFLGKNQIVTLKELMQGLCVSSGNDAAYAIALYIEPTMEDFIKRMNSLAVSLGLKHTSFVECSGYSEKNITCAKDLAEFSTIYLKKYPSALEYHSALSFTYPKEENLPQEYKSRSRNQNFTYGIPDIITMPIYQKNTNPLLDIMPGCDGLKTGYIDESGYNLALTVTREGMRFISVTLGGSGRGAIEGNQGRVKDGNTLMNWGFQTFIDYKNALIFRDYLLVALKSSSVRVAVRPAFTLDALTIPRNLLITKNSSDDNIKSLNPKEIETLLKEKVKIDVTLPPYIEAPVKMGEVYGTLTFSLNGYTLQKIPLVAVRDYKVTNKWFCLADNFAKFFI